MNSEQIDGAVYFDRFATRGDSLDKINQEFTRLEMMRESARHLTEVARVAFSCRSSYEIDVRFDALRDAIKAEAAYRQAVHDARIHGSLGDENDLQRFEYHMKSMHDAVEAIESQFMEELLNI